MDGVPVIRIRNLIYRWRGAAEDCLDIPSFEVARGEHLFLHGPSGSGKSTLLGLLGGVLLPTRGQLELLGAQLPAMTASARDRFRADNIGIIFQQFNLIPYLSVLDNVLLPLRFSRRRNAQACERGASPQSEAIRLLEQLGLVGDIARREATRLSVGQQQRVAAARALIGRPGILIADEPTSAMDAELQAVFVDLLLQEAKDAEATVIFVSHDRRLADRFPRRQALAEISRVRSATEPA